MLSTWTPRDASVSAHVIAACRGHAAEISFAGDVGLLSYELIGPVNPFAPEVRFVLLFKTKAAYEAYKTHASVPKFEKLLEAQGADKPTLEFFAKVEQGQKYAANSRNMGLPLDVSKGIGIIATFNCKTPEIIQAAMKVSVTHFERQFSTEPYSTGYSILFDESKPNTFGEQIPTPRPAVQQPVHGVTLTPACRVTLSALRAVGERGRLLGDPLEEPDLAAAPRPVLRRGGAHHRGRVRDRVLLPVGARPGAEDARAAQVRRHG